MLELLLPHTDAGALVQLAVTLAVGLPTLVVLHRRRSTEVMWFVAGVLALVLGIFALRTVH